MWLSAQYCFHPWHNPSFPAWTVTDVKEDWRMSRRNSIWILPVKKQYLQGYFLWNAKNKKKIIPGLGDDSEGLLPLFCVLRFTDYDHKHKPSNLSTGKPEKPSEISLFVVFKQPLVQKMSMKTNSRLWSIVSSTACMKLYLLSVCLFLFFLLDWSV